MKEEIWKDIANYEGLYQVSNMGRIRSVSRILTNVNVRGGKYSVKGKVLADAERKNGYKFIPLCKNKKRKNYLIHRLVAEAFIDKNTFKSRENEDRSKIDLNNLQVNHKDEDKSNNRVENLEWCTERYNKKYSFDTGKHIAPKAMLNKFGKLHPKSKSVIQYDMEGNFIKKWSCMMDIYRHLKINKKCSNISSCCKGKIKSAYGYIWRYSEV